MKLHETKGRNARAAYCPRCGGDAPAPVEIGAHEQISRCDDCGAMHYGYSSGQKKCGGCGEHALQYVRDLDENDKVPGSPCDDCLEEIEVHQRIVAAGGVYFRCHNCGEQGVIDRNEFTTNARKVLGCEPPKLCGVEFTIADPCPRCRDSTGAAAAASRSRTGDMDLENVLGDKKGDA